MSGLWGLKHGRRSYDIYEMTACTGWFTIGNGMT